MRILSEFHDYYDSVQKTGQDQSIIYMRKKQSYSPEEIDSIKEDHKKYVLKAFNHCCSAHIRNFKELDFGGQWSSSPPIQTKDHEFYTSHHIFLFCGKIYPILLLQTLHSHRASASQKYHWIYNFEQLEEFLSDYKVFEHKSYTNSSQYGYKKSLDTKINRFKQWFNYEPKFCDSEWLIENKIISLLLDVRTNYYTSETNIITINPCLKDIQFYKVMDAYTTFQELDMYISGTLSYPQNKMVEVSNEQKVVKHGFDPKYGFRKRKI